MKPSLLARLENLEQRLAEVNLLLSSEQAARDLDALRRLNREHAELSQVVEHLQAWKQAGADQAAAGLRQLVDVVIPKREAEQARFLSTDFVPGGGWWDDPDRGRKAP